MALSNLIAFFIVITTAATLHAHGITDIQSSAEAAEALRAVAGRFTFVVFAAGIIGTGLLTLPVLAGSAAYAVGELFSWHVGLARRPLRGKGILRDHRRGDGDRRRLEFHHHRFGQGALSERGLERRGFRTRDGRHDAPLSMRPAIMAGYTLPLPLRILGWVATVVMAITVMAMVATWLVRASDGSRLSMPRHWTLALPRTPLVDQVCNIEQRALFDRLEAFDASNS